MSNIAYILDESGSMLENKEEAKQSLNNSIAQQKLVPNSENCSVTIVTFNDNVKIITDAQKLSDVAEFTEYNPNGMTALRDAIFTTINLLLSKPGHKNSVITVITDGMENCSHLCSKEVLKALIKVTEVEHGWKFVFLGASQSVIEGGINSGIKPEGCAVYDQSPGGLLNLARAVSSQVADYRNATINRDHSAPPPELDIRSLSTPSRAENPIPSLPPQLVRSHAFPARAISGASFV